MSDVKVGMRLVDPKGGPLSRITVTEITEKGFRYSIDEETPFIPRWGLTFAKDGHEHYGINGECLYEQEV